MSIPRACRGLIAAVAGVRPFDIMLEAKAKDLALPRLRDQMGEFALELAAVVG